MLYTENEWDIIQKQLKNRKLVYMRSSNEVRKKIMLYTENEWNIIQKQLKNRKLVCMGSSGLILALAVAIFIYGQVSRSTTLWYVTMVLTIVGGSLLFFLYGIFVRPMRIYKTHVDYMLHGRKSTTTGILKSISADTYDKDGLSCYAIYINIGETDEPMDDRLFYWDALKPLPTQYLQKKVTITSNDKMIASFEKI